MSGMSAAVGVLLVRWDHLGRGDVHADALCKLLDEVRLTPPEPSAHRQGGNEPPRAHLSWFENIDLVLRRSVTSSGDPAVPDSGGDHVGGKDERTDSIRLIQQRIAALNRLLDALIGAGGTDVLVAEDVLDRLLALGRQRGGGCRPNPTERLDVVLLTEDLVHD